MTDSTTPQEHVFVIMQIGSKESLERRRADEVFTYVIKPALEARGLEARRADLDVSPGSITQKLLKDLVEAKLVIADLTGRNPNVYYELGIAHSFAKPLIAIADSVSGLPFDNKDERVIELGEYPESGLPVAKVESTKKILNEALDIVLAEGFDVPTPLKEVAGARSLDALAPNDPVAAELAQMRELLEDVRAKVTPRRVVPASMQHDFNALRDFMKDFVMDGVLTAQDLSPLITPETSEQFDAWVRDLQEHAPVANKQPNDPWSSQPTSAPPWTTPATTSNFGSSAPSEEPPF